MEELDEKSNTRGGPIIWEYILYSMRIKGLYCQLALRSWDTNNQAACLLYQNTPTQGLWRAVWTVVVYNVNSYKIIHILFQEPHISQKQKIQRERKQDRSKAKSKTSKTVKIFLYRFRKGAGNEKETSS